MGSGISEMRPRSAGNSKIVSDPGASVADSFPTVHKRAATAATPPHHPPESHSPTGTLPTLTQHFPPLAVKGEAAASPVPPSRSPLPSPYKPLGMAGTSKTLTPQTTLSPSLQQLNGISDTNTPPLSPSELEDASWYPPQFGPVVRPFLTRGAADSHPVSELSTDDVPGCSDDKLPFYIWYVRVHEGSVRGLGNRTATAQDLLAKCAAENSRHHGGQSAGGAGLESGKNFLGSYRSRLPAQRAAAEKRCSRRVDAESTPPIDPDEFVQAMLNYSREQGRSHFFVDKDGEIRRLYRTLGWHQLRTPERRKEEERRCSSSGITTPTVEAVSQHRHNHSSSKNSRKGSKRKNSTATAEERSAHKSHVSHSGVTKQSSLSSNESISTPNPALDTQQEGRRRRSHRSHSGSSATLHHGPPLPVTVTALAPPSSNSDVNPQTAAWPSESPPPASARTTSFRGLRGGGGEATLRNVDTGAASAVRSTVSPQDVVPAPVKFLSPILLHPQGSFTDLTRRGDGDNGRLSRPSSASSLKYRVESDGDVVNEDALSPMGSRRRSTSRMGRRVSFTQDTRYFRKSPMYRVSRQAEGCAYAELSVMDDVAALLPSKVSSESDASTGEGQLSMKKPPGSYGQLTLLKNKMLQRPEHCAT